MMDRTDVMTGRTGAMRDRADTDGGGAAAVRDRKTNGGQDIHYRSENIGGGGGGDRKGNLILYHSNVQLSIMRIY